MVRTNKFCILKKIILFLFGLMLTSVAFSQVEGYLAIFEQVSLIETKEKIWTISDNRAFKTKGETYVLAYEPLNFDKSGDSYFDLKRGNVRDKDLYLYRKTDFGWEEASLVIRHDYFHWHDVKYNTPLPDSLQALDSHQNKYDPQCYGKIDIESSGKVTIQLKTMVWMKGEPIAHYIYDDLILTPNGNKTYDFILIRIK